MEELRKRLIEQDNRITQDPLFCVQTMRKTSPIDPRYADGGLFEWIDSTSGDYETYDKAELIAELTREGAPNAAELVDETEDEVEWDGQTYERVFYGTYWEMVTVHFTEKAADDYVAQNAHNLGEHRIFVTSQYRCHEWNAVRAMLMKAAP